MQRSLRRILPASLLLAGFSVASARGQDACTAVVVHGVGGPTIFVDDFESGGTSVWSQSAVPAFSLVKTVDLTVEVSIDGTLAGDHLLTLAWRLPGGGLYQSVAVPFTIPAADTGAGEPAPRRIAGYPFPVRTRVARRLSGNEPGASPNGVLVVADRLPVAGTSIVDAALSGDWSLDVRLDDDEAVCATAGFRLEP